MQILKLSLAVLTSAVLLGCGKDSQSSSAPQAPAANATAQSPAAEKADARQAAHLPTSKCLDGCKSAKKECLKADDVKVCTKQYLCCVTLCSGESCKR